MDGARETLCRMRGLSLACAEAFLARCEPEEVQAIATSATGADLQCVLDAVADRLAATKTE